MASKNVLTKLSEESLAKQPEEVFDIICKLGEGSYGSVYKALNKESGHVLAIKQVPVDTDLQEIIKEISIMQQCDSPYVVKYYGSYFKNSDLWIIMEFCEAGSVSDIIKLRKKTLTEDEIATILYDVLKGLEYLHSCRKIHRDIKAANILLTLEGYAKLADFGVACQLTDTIAKRNTLIGTPFWMAPEIIQEIGYNCVADIWSLGITALEMAEGKPPYGEIHPMRAIFMIPIKPPPSFHKPDQWSPEFIDFVSICLVKNPEERATAINLLQHVFINNAKQPNILKQMISEAQEIREKKFLRTTTEIISENVKENVMTRNQTMVEHPNESTLINNTLGLRLQREQLLELQSELGTMVINNDEKTMKYDSATAKTFYINKEHSDGNSDSDTEGALGHCHYYQEQLMPIGNSFQKALSDSNYSHLKFLTYEELQQRMATLDADMEREIDELRRRYQTKGQPILDAMDNKRKRQQNF